MTQAELARALGISPALVSKLKRRGMPVHSAEAAAAWRRRHVGPYLKPGATSYAPPLRPAADPSRPARQRPMMELLTQSDLADPADVIEAIIREHVLIPQRLAKTLLRALELAAAEQLAAGQDISDDVRCGIALVLEGLPDDDRVLPKAIWDALCGTYAADEGTP